ncbi:hypothetical protein [Paraburkholderia kururiensis]|uniref:Uncharacterized protein n=1 Tax=Paraburkholderia kururiensis TaxID=984307 RepID=A0ABZ0WV39_9BURK|nr:hypothetical protein [Paraburkholderia kururiensis]WQD81264.1 hypothetical protein U0042_29775 [Paraburkholderia kururiensis]
MAAEDRLREAVRTREEAAMALAFEESHRLLDRIEALKDTVPASLAGVTGKFFSEAQRHRAALDEYASALRQDVTGIGDEIRGQLVESAEKITTAATATREAIRQLAESAQQNARKAGDSAVAAARDEAAQIAHAEAMRAFADVSKLKMQELETAVNEAVRRFGVVQDGYDKLLGKTNTLAEKIESQQLAGQQGSWGRTLAGSLVVAVVTAGLVLVGQSLLSHQSLTQLSSQVSYLISRANGTASANPAASYDSWGAAVLETWATLPPDARQKIQRAHDQVR